MCSKIDAMCSKIDAMCSKIDAMCNFSIPYSCQDKILFTPPGVKEDFS